MKFKYLYLYILFFFITALEFSCGSINIDNDNDNDISLPKGDIRFKKNTEKDKNTAGKDLQQHATSIKEDINQKVENENEPKNKNGDKDGNNKITNDNIDRNRTKSDILETDSIEKSTEEFIKALAIKAPDPDGISNNKISKKIKNSPEIDMNSMKSTISQKQKDKIKNQIKKLNSLKEVIDYFLNIKLHKDNLEELYIKIKEIIEKADNPIKEHKKAILYVKSKGSHKILSKIEELLCENKKLDEILKNLSIEELIEYFYLLCKGYYNDKLIKKIQEALIKKIERLSTSELLEYIIGRNTVNINNNLKTFKSDLIKKVLQKKNIKAIEIDEIIINKIGDNNLKWDNLPINDNNDIKNLLNNKNLIDLGKINYILKALNPKAAIIFDKKLSQEIKRKIDNLYANAIEYKYEVLSQEKGHIKYILKIYFTKKDGTKTTNFLIKKELCRSILTYNLYNIYFKIFESIFYEANKEHLISVKKAKEKIKKSHQSSKDNQNQSTNSNNFWNNFWRKDKNWTDWNNQQNESNYNSYNNTNNKDNQNQSTNSNNFWNNFWRKDKNWTDWNNQQNESNYNSYNNTNNKDNQNQSANSYEFNNLKPNEKYEKNNFYETLEVNINSDPKAIKKAYRKLAKQYHPDRHPNADDKEKYEEKFKEIGQAHDVLKDPKKRKEYDKYWHKYHKNK